MGSDQTLSSSTFSLSTDIEKWTNCLINVNEPLGKRTHAAFFLRTNGNLEACQGIMRALANKEDSALLRHELAYILGQMQNPAACELLTSILRDENDDVMVRHESAEALGAIGDYSAIKVLEEFLELLDPSQAW